MSDVDTLTATIASLESAIFSGVLRARINERDTTFRSMPEMKEALRMANAKLAALQPPSSIRRTRQTRFYTSSGL